MKKLLVVITGLLAMNFLAVAGGVGYLWRSGHLDKTRVMAIKELLFPAPPPPTAQSAGSASGATTQPSVDLVNLIKSAAGLPAEDQLAFLQRSFDARVAHLDLRERELADQQRELDISQRKVADDRAALLADRKKLTDEQQQAAINASDQGFQDSLQLYSVMPSKQVKTIFMTLADATVQRYLEAMPPRTAAKIIKEFKNPDETSRIQKVLERMRNQNPSVSPPASASASGP